MNDYIKSTNQEGYPDPTAYEAMKNIVREEKEKDNERHSQLIKTILYICHIAGFDVYGRICLRDRASGKIWR